MGKARLACHADALDPTGTAMSAAHPNPVVLLHGLGATYYEDLNYLELFLQQKGYCTFSLTYGAFPAFPYVGGLKKISDSSQEIGTFIRAVQQQTAASKIDIVGHSEGAFQSLYVPKFTGVASIIDKIVAIAPPTHGTTFGGIYDLAYVGGNVTRQLNSVILNTVGCGACDDLGPGGSAVIRLNDGKPIKQPGNTLTVIASQDDELVTPTYTAFVNETGVNNLYIQTTCPNDRVGHVGEAYDTNVWNLIVNALDPVHAAPFACSSGCPGK
ncbi:hypothetical protein FH972_023821 [Carpinus fangiana]|uniref:AB hydrolase-1 domain-containing protein n=1 Tax=Carpinus fangiana TaxID=176857 RepID=A0A5N6KWS4_9ROSI|nr:hypothetical protein FH972_023821 [Carpinus fangiana]